MAPKQSSANLGSEGYPQDANYDLKKMKRKESNRLSAKRSRERKQQQLAELHSQASCLMKENESVSERIDATSEMYLKVASQNDVLRAQIAELTDRLHSMNEVIHAASAVNGVAFDTQETPDILLEPWQLPFPAQSILPEPWQLPPFPAQPIAASADYFLY